MRSNASEIATGILKRSAYQSSHNNKKRGGVVHFENNIVAEQQPQGFTTEDVLWAVGIWSVILTLSPVVLFYVLMVA